MGELKLYVFDHGWSGAEIYVTDSDEDAKAYFLSDNIERNEEGLRKHMEAHPKQVNPWPKNIEFWKSGEYWNHVQRYDIVKGLEVLTEGE